MKKKLRHTENTWSLSLLNCLYPFHHLSSFVLSVSNVMKTHSPSLSPALSPSFFLSFFLVLVFLFPALFIFYAINFSFKNQKRTCIYLFVPLDPLFIFHSHTYSFAYSFTCREHGGPALCSWHMYKEFLPI